MTRKRFVKSITVGGALLTLIIAICLYMYFSRIGRFVRGVSTIAVANESTVTIHNASISLLTDKPGPINLEFDAILPGEYQAIPVNTPDLILEYLNYTINGEEYSYTGGGIACPGERFILSIEGPDQVTTRYDP